MSKRIELAREIGEIKGSSSTPYFIPEREQQIIQRLTSLPDSSLKPAQIKAIFVEIMSAARAAEKPIVCAYWGPPGSFSHLAAIQSFGRSSKFVATKNIREVFRKVEQGQADYGIVPIENSIGGVIPETLDFFAATNLKICSESVIPIHHCLASGGASLDSINRIYAGPQPLTQCRHWISQNLPQAEIVDMSPTSKAGEATLIDPEGAAIVNTMAIETLGLTLLAENIEDDSNNRTRFVVLGANEPEPTGSDKTTLLFNLRNRPGELYRVLGAFVEHDVNLLMIESRPASRASFEYLFYVDCAGHRSNPHLTQAIEKIQGFALETSILGSYPSNDPQLMG